MSNLEENLILLMLISKLEILDLQLTGHLEVIPTEMEIAFSNKEEMMMMMMTSIIKIITLFKVKVIFF